MPDLFPFLLSGLALGAVYAVSAVGIVVLYRATGVLNLAHGALGAVAALVAWQLLETGYVAGTAYPVAVLLAAALAGLYGVLISPRVAHRDVLVRAACTLGYALILLGLAYWFWTDDPRALRLPTDTVGFDLAGARVTGTHLLAVGLALGLTGLTAAALRWTGYGRQMRALAADREVSALLGVRTRRVEALAWTLSGAVAGGSGIVLADLTRLEAGSLTFLVVASLAAGVVARFRSLGLTLAAGFGIGVLESTGGAFPDVSPYRSVTPFMVAIAAMLWYGRRRRYAGTVIDVRSAATAVAAGGGGGWRPLPSGTPVRAAVVLVVGAALLAVAVPVLFDGYWTRVLTGTAIFAVAAGGIGLLYGRLGLVSLSQVALLGVGGWVTLRLSFGTDLPFLAIALIAGLVTCLVGVVWGLPALRLGGLEFALVSLMAGGAFEVVFHATGFPDGGGGLLGRVGGTQLQQSLARPEFAASDDAFFRLSLVLLVGVFLLVLLHERSRAGRAWAAIRHGRAGALASGVPVTRYTMWAFALSAFGTGMAGALLATSAGRLDPISFRAPESILLFAAVLIGGAYGLLGAVIAGIVSQTVPALLDAAGVNGNVIIAVLGVGLIHALVTAPRGIAGQLESLGHLLRRLAARPARPARLEEGSPAGADAPAVVPSSARGADDA